MKSNLLSVLISFCSFFLLVQMVSAKKEEMVLLLNEGQNYTYLITQENTIQEKPGVIMMNQKMALKIDHEVIGQLSNGNYQIEATIKSFSIELKYNGKTTRYHSDTIEVMNSLYKNLNFLTGIKLRYQVSPKGIINDLSGFEIIKNKMKTDKQLSGLLRSFGNEQFILEMYQYIPDGSVGLGNQWNKTSILPDFMNENYDIQFTLKEVLPQSYKITQKATFDYQTNLPKEIGMEGKVDEKGTQNGYLLINPTSKMRISSDINQKIDILIQEKTTEQKEKIAPKSIITHTTMVLMKN